MSVVFIYLFDPNSRAARRRFPACALRAASATPRSTSASVRATLLRRRAVRLQARRTTFRAGEGGYFTFRIPSLIIRLPNGDLACYRAAATASHPPSAPSLRVRTFSLLWEKREGEARFLGPSLFERSVSRILTAQDIRVAQGSARKAPASPTGRRGRAYH